MSLTLTPTPDGKVICIDNSKLDKRLTVSKVGLA